MPRKVSIPGTSEILQGREPGRAMSQEASPTPEASATPSREVRRGSGRVRHDDKITVYVSREELVRLEQARLSLRADHGLAVDRGRIVREAVAAALDDLNDNGPDSELLKRLTDQ